MKLKKSKQPSGSLRADPDITKEIKLFCKDNGILMYHFVTEALKDKLYKLKNEKSSS